MTKFSVWRGGLGLSLVAAALVTAGCSQTGSSGGDSKGKGAAKGKGAEVAQTGKGDHSGWWCNEHGVPEEVCGLCSAKVAKEMKDKGDWCKEHDRPESQCFICHPNLKEKFAAQYRAKYGKEPPLTEDEEKAKKAGDKGKADGKD